MLWSTETSRIRAKTRTRKKKQQHRNEEEGIRRGMGEELILHSAFIVL